jgi:putative ABC transport system ATP-binding protein
MKVLEVVNLSKTYGHGRTAVHAVRGVSFSLEEGEMVLIMGPSGSGKTTLLSMIGCLLTPTSGRVFICGEEVTSLPQRRLSEIRLKRLGFVFQSFNLLSSLTALENVLVALNLAGVRGREAKERAEGLLRLVGLGGRLDHLPHELSGGERQRVAIARALANEPKIILADEPTGNLDSKTGHRVVELLRRAAKEGNRSVIIASHDHRIREMADRVLYLEDGRLSNLTGH